MMVKALLGKEVLDRNGNVTGWVEDFVFDDKNRLTHVVVKPKSLVGPLKPMMNVHVDDVGAFTSIVMLKKTKEEMGA
jgi:sporulation protein YlmC with PRC-barrel domain